MRSSIKIFCEKEIIAILGAGMSFFLATLLVRYIALPAWDGARAAYTGLTQYQALISGTSTDNKLRKEIMAKERLLKEKHAALIKDIRVPHDLSGLLQILFDKAWEVKIRFDRTMPQPERQERDFIAYPVILETITDYNSLGKFISSLEEIPQLVSVDRMAITVKTNDAVAVRMLITCFLAVSE